MKHPKPKTSSLRPYPFNLFRPNTLLKGKIIITIIIINNKNKTRRRCDFSFSLISTFSRRRRRWWGDSDRRRAPLGHEILHWRYGGSPLPHHIHFSTSCLIFFWGFSVVAFVLLNYANFFIQIWTIMVYTFTLTINSDFESLLLQFVVHHHILWFFNLTQSWLGFKT